MAVAMAAQFSRDGKYFAQITTDGKLKIWNTFSNTFEQEFTPDYHLTSPCLCLHFYEKEEKDVSPRKKKRRESESLNCPSILLGTSSGTLFVYSIAISDVQTSISSNTKQPITCLTVKDSIAYAGVEKNITFYNLQQNTSKNGWKTGNDNISALLAVPNKRLLSASKSIKLWNTETKQLLKTFTGHSSDIVLLKYVTSKQNGDSYFVSGSKGDRALSCWNLNEAHQERNAIASFLMEDVVQNISINVTPDGATHMAVVVRNGVTHVYQHTLNGKCSKPLKPKTSLQVVCDTGQNDVITPIRIVGAFYRDDNTLCIGHGNELTLTFENIAVTTDKKLQCLLRNDPKKVNKQEQASKLKTPIIGNDVHYITPQSSAKRKIDGKQEVPMEKRLENLTLNKVDGGVPKADNVAQLLVQGLHSNDKTILKTVLSKRDENVIRNTVKRLPFVVLNTLIQELTAFIKGKTVTSEVGTIWLRNIIKVHSGILLSNPNLTDLLQPALGSIETRLSLQTPLSRLKGRLDLLVSQLTTNSTESIENEEPLMVYNDKVGSDSDSEDMEIDAVHSESDNEWEEESENEEENSHSRENHVDENGDSDSDVMSS